MIHRPLMPKPFHLGAALSLVLCLAGPAGALQEPPPAPPESPTEESPSERSPAEGPREEGPREEDPQEENPQPQTEKTEKSEKTEKTEVAEIPVTFEGSGAISTSRLKRAVSDLLEEYARDPREAYLDDAAYEIRALYRTQGYTEIEVEYEAPREAPLEAPREASARTGGGRVVFKIQPGVRTTIKAIRFTGNTSYSSDQLRTFFDSAREGFVNQSEGPYSRSRVRSEAGEVQSFYRSAGFLEAEVAEPLLEWSEDRKEVTVTIPVDEGPLYRLETLRFEGMEVLGESLLGSLEAEFAGRPYHPRIPFQIRGRLQTAFGNQGYPDADIEPEVVMDDDSGAVDVVVRADAGPRVTVSEVVIEGAEKTRHNFIRSRMLLEAGELYDESQERLSFRNLYRTGLFRSVRISLGDPPEDLGEPASLADPAEDASEDQGAGQGSRRPLIVQVEEGSAREAFLEPGFGSYEGLRLLLGYREHNLFGTGSRLDVEATVAQKALRSSVTYSDPWALVESLTTELSLSTKQREEDGYTTVKTGFGVGLRQEWSDKVSSTLGYQFRRTEVEDLVTGLTAPPVSQDDADISSLRLTNRYDDRDNIFVPRDGWRAELDLEYAAENLGSELDFFRVSGSVSFYEALAEPTTLALSLRGGAILLTGREISIPVQERFKSGGENSIRAFEEGQVLPFTEDGMALVDDDGNSLGGEGFATFTAELRQRLYGNLQGALFVDTGFLTARAAGLLNPHKIETGAGVGLRYLLPIGPLRLDGAWNLDPGEGEDSFVLHFSVGMAI